MGSDDGDAVDVPEYDGLKLFASWQGFGQPLLHAVRLARCGSHHFYRFFKNFLAPTMSFHAQERGFGAQKNGEEMVRKWTGNGENTVNNGDRSTVFYISHVRRVSSSPFYIRGCKAAAVRFTDGFHAITRKNYDYCDGGDSGRAVASIAGVPHEA
jgi:hypothetical protein